MKIGFWSVAEISYNKTQNRTATNTNINWLIGLDVKDMEDLLNEISYISIEGIKFLGLNPLRFVVRNTSRTDEKILLELEPTLYINLTKNELKQIQDGDVKKFHIPKVGFSIGKGIVGLSKNVFDNIKFVDEEKETDRSALRASICKTTELALSA